jgi:hypothetical protein
MATAVQDLWKKLIAMGLDPRSTEGFYIPGQMFHVAPFNQRTVMDLTVPFGKASGIFYSLMFYLAKVGYQVFKVEDWEEVSPVSAEYYSITTAQKQQLENQIKTGLGSLGLAFADFELLLHDYRKYMEFMDYYEKLEVGKETKDEKMVTESEQSLKAIFIDQVDVHTGEGIALKMIAPRWPTIIADFMRLKDEDTEPQIIAKNYQVSEAEGVVLATKNKLYKEWRDKLFKPNIVERYARLKVMMNARKKSVDEYRNMLKPYIARYRSIRELGETPEGRSLLEMHSWKRPGVQAVSMEFTTTWAWKQFHAYEPFRTSTVGEVERKDVLKIPFPPAFKQMLKNNYRVLKDEGLDKVDTSKNGIEPIDEWVMAFIPYIEDKYKVKLTPVDILKTRNNLIEKFIDPYFIVLELRARRTVLRLPDGSQRENIVYDPFISYFDSQNMILLRLLELKAKEIEQENYISEMLGETAEGKKLKDMIETDYPKVFESEKEKPKVEEKPKDILSGIFKTFKAEGKGELLKKSVAKTSFPIKFFKPGPYETTFDDRVTGQYFREVAGKYEEAVSYLKSLVGVPGFKLVYTPGPVA